MRQRAFLRQEGNVRCQRLCVLVADADGLARATTSEALYASGRVAVVLCASDGWEVRALAQRYGPAVVLIDTSLPGPLAITEVIAEIRDACPQTRVLTMAAGDDAAAISALRAGAVGHVGKDLAAAVVARQVMRVADGEAVIPRRLTMELLCLLHEAPDTGWRPLRSRLTTREWEVVDLLGDGAGTQEIADALVLSRTTVYSHIKSVSRKLGVHTRGEAIVAAEELRREEALGINLPRRVA
ncbi:MAG TPA: response regulator transcription factor [Solirubrobacteraceae bacterium]|nr:response regulator transcription factor [Solirubrobacteraceae bacterium]